MSGANGEHRDARGRFLPGNSGGPGNPHARATSRLRARLLARVSDADFDAVIDALVRQAKAGDLAAVRELLDRTIGRPEPSSEIVPARLRDDFARAAGEIADLMLARLPDDGKEAFHRDLGRIIERAIGGDG